MKLNDLKRASDHEVEEWLIENLKLTPYQKEILIQDEIVRFSEFYFYKREKFEKSSILWRLTIIIYPIYLILIFAVLPIKWVFTGRWGYGRKFYENFHCSWTRKLGL